MYHDFNKYVNQPVDKLSVFYTLGNELDMIIILDNKNIPFHPEIMRMKVYVKRATKHALTLKRSDSLAYV